MNKKEKSHEKYNNLTKEQKSRLIEYGRSKLPPILQNNKVAIDSEIYRRIRSKL